MRTLEEIEQVEALLGQGMSDYEIARRTGIPRGTVRNWRCAPPARDRPRLTPIEWRPEDAAAYCYVLGLYLGDGHLVVGKASGMIRLYLDEKYESIIAEASGGLGRVFPGRRVLHYTYGKGRRVIVQVSSPMIRFAFPQHGPGRKHDRPIRLEPWQVELTRDHPQALLRGLIQSDGCRVVNRFSTRLPSGRLAEYSYARYFFSNLSPDIRWIFCHHCELLGIHWTQSNPRNISVSDRRSVALLDSFVGPKM